MKNSRSLFRSKRGETLAETLISLLIISISSAMLAGAIISAARINASSQTQDLALYEAASAIAEKTADTSAGQVTIGSHSVPVTVYSGGGLKAYE